MKDWTIEYESYWSDGCKDYEQTFDLQAESKEDAIQLGKQRLNEMDNSDNYHCYCVSRKFIRCVESDDFTYLSSAKEDSGIYKNAGYIDITKWNGL
ncbi:hypothetical protein HZP32_05680 [Elizabethkingia anophelis]|nr:hypothetical protein [Elizabethkingia anophelis]